MDEAIKFLCDRVKSCQYKGAFSLKDAHILKGCVDFLTTGKSSNEQLNKENSLDAVVQSINLAQAKGCFSLEEACEIFVVIEKIQTLLPQEKHGVTEL